MINRILALILSIMFILSKKTCGGRDQKKTKTNYVTSSSTFVGSPGRLKTNRMNLPDSSGS